MEQYIENAKIIIHKLVEQSCNSPDSAIYQMTRSPGFRESESVFMYIAAINREKISQPQPHL